MFGGGRLSFPPSFFWRSMEQGSFKDLEEVSLKATYDIEIGDRIIHAGEILAYFDKIQISNLREIKDYVSANGGFGNRAHVFWETTKEEIFNFSQGVFSKTQLALLSNAKLIQITNEPISIHQREYLESSCDGKIKCKYTPISDIFIYDESTGEKLSYTQEDNILTISDHYKNVIVDYQYNYPNGASLIQFGKRLFNGFVSLEGKTRVKDDITGHVVTGLIKIPKLKLMSDLSMRLGAQANPVVANFNAIGVPVGSRNQSYVMEFYYLNDDITSDL